MKTSRLFAHPRDGFLRRASLSPSAGIRSSAAASDGCRNSLHPHLPGLHPRAAGSAAAGETGFTLNCGPLWTFQWPDGCYTVASQWLMIISHICFFNPCACFSFFLLCPDRFLRSSCCRTCVLSMLCPSPSAWPDWQSV